MMTGCMSLHITFWSAATCRPLEQQIGKAETYNEAETQNLQTAMNFKPLRNIQVVFTYLAN
jgi:hypothetical protein